MDQSYGMLRTKLGSITCKSNGLPIMLSPSFIIAPFASPQPSTNDLSSHVVSLGYRILELYSAKIKNIWKRVDQHFSYIDQGYKPTSSFSPLMVHCPLECLILNRWISALIVLFQILCGIPFPVLVSTSEVSGEVGVAVWNRHFGFSLYPFEICDQG